MSESSTEKSAETTEVQDEPKQEPQKESKKVPVEAVAKERAEKRAARAEADELRKDKANRDEFDDSLIETIAQRAKEAVEREMEPVRAENARLKMAVEHGLNGEQSEKVMELQGKHPGLTVQQCLLLARTEAPDLFPSESSGNPVPGYLRGLPAGGDSQVRTSADAKDHVRLMHEARAKGDVMTAQRHAAMAFEERFQRLRNPAR